MRSRYGLGMLGSVVCALAMLSGSRADAGGAVGMHGGHIAHGRLDHGHNDFRNSHFGLGAFGLGSFDGWGFYGCDIGGNDERIPFYALHPPVYYSHIVARSYGWTPFAYTPDAIILPLEDGGSKEIINPFVPPSNPTPTPPKAKPTSEQTADAADATIHVVVNPYAATALADADK